jgi:hypothetical protein
MNEGLAVVGIIVGSTLGVREGALLGATVGAKDTVGAADGVNRFTILIVAAESETLVAVADAKILPGPALD